MAAGPFYTQTKRWKNVLAILLNVADAESSSERQTSAIVTHAPTFENVCDNALWRLVFVVPPVLITIFGGDGQILVINL